MVIERKGADVGMITTRGFRDILHMARHKRPHNFSLQFDVPWQSKPLVQRRNRLSWTERMLPPTGEVEVPLAHDQVEAGGGALQQARWSQSLSSAFFSRFSTASMRLQAHDIVRATLPDVFVCACSHEVVNAIREYERFSSRR